MEDMMGRRYGAHSRGRIRRSRQNRWFAGVCGGIAEHFDVSAFWIRVMFVFGSFVIFPAPLIAYIIMVFVMPRADQTYVPPIPQPVPQPVQQPIVEQQSQRPSTQARMEPAYAQAKKRENQPSLKTLEAEFDEIENKIRMMEDYVTSKEFQVQKKFENL